MKRLVCILISFLVQQVIIFSENRAGLYDVHTVANCLSGLVAKNVTKSATDAQFEAAWLIYKGSQFF